MESQIKTKIFKDLKNKKLQITREFEAPVEQVWKAWTDSKILDLWWAPKPWKAKTKTMDFRDGGFWLYAMLGPEGEEHWARVDFQTIVPFKSFIITDSFCDSNGIINKDLPGMGWVCDFKKSDTGTSVEIEITFNNLADLEKIIEMGFEAGFTSALENLDELL